MLLLGSFTYAISDSCCKLRYVNTEVIAFLKQYFVRLRPENGRFLEPINRNITPQKEKESRNKERERRKRTRTSYFGVAILAHSVRHIIIGHVS